MRCYTSVGSPPLQATGPISGPTAGPLGGAVVGGPAPGASVAASPSQRCPRCGAPVAGAYKFCPACAFRLRTDLAEPVPSPSPGTTWKARFFGASLIAAFLAAALGGVVLLRPTPPVEAVTPPQESARFRHYEQPVFTVAGILDELVELPAWGEAMTYPEKGVGGLTDEQREWIEGDPIAAGQMKVKIWYSFRMMKYEVTQGQWAEFIRHLADHREEIPKIWEEIARGTKPPPEDVLLQHVPSSWLLRDEKDRVVGWSLEESRTNSPNWPVSDVSFGDASEFAQWAARKLGVDLRLPVLPEWVRAARGGKLENLWPWEGREPYVFACNNAGIWWPNVGQPRYVHFRYEPLTGDHAGGKTIEGLYGMAGNVWEWADDCEFQGQPEEFERLPVAYPVRTSAPKQQVYACGGSYRVGIDDCQVESRELLYRYERRPDIGFRLVVSQR